LHFVSADWLLLLPLLMRNWQGKRGDSWREEERREKEEEEKQTTEAIAE
jgi:hypothetical protein